MSGLVDVSGGEVGLLVEASGLAGVKVAFMNLGRGCVATHEYLKWCARGGVRVAFVGECWVEWRGGQATQSHPDYVRLASVSVAHRVACFILRSLVDVCRLVECTHRFVCVEVRGVRLGGCMGIVARASMVWSSGWMVSGRWLEVDVGSFLWNGMRTTMRSL